MTDPGTWFLSVLRAVQQTGRLGHTIIVPEMLLGDLNPMRWCRANLGDDAIVLSPPPSMFVYDPAMVWTYNGCHFYFDTEADALAFYMHHEPV